MSNYLVGRRFEYRVKRKLEKDGYLVIRSAGSHSPFDLIAITKNEILLVQCKKNGNGLRSVVSNLAKVKEKYVNGFVKVYVAVPHKRKIIFVEV